MGILGTDTEPADRSRLDEAFDVDVMSPEELRITRGGKEAARLFGGNVPLIAEHYERLRRSGGTRADDFIAGCAFTAAHHAMAVYQGDRGGVHLPSIG